MNKCRFYTKNDILKAIGHIKKAAPTHYLKDENGNKQDRSYLGGSITDSVAEQNAREPVYSSIKPIKQVGSMISNGLDWSYDNTDPANTEDTARPTDLKSYLDSVTQQITSRVGNGLTAQQAKQMVDSIRSSVSTGEALQPHVQNLLQDFGINLPTLETGQSKNMLKGTSSALGVGINGYKTYRNGANAVEEFQKGNYLAGAGETADATHTAGKTVQDITKTLDTTKDMLQDSKGKARYVGQLAGKAKEYLENIPGFKRVGMITDLAEIGAIIKDPSIKSFLEHAPSVADGLAQMGLKIAGPAGEMIAAYQTGQDLGEWIANTTGMSDAAEQSLEGGYKQTSDIVNNSTTGPTTMDYANAMKDQFGRAVYAEGKALGDFISTSMSPENRAVVDWYNKKHGTNFKAMTQQMYDEAWHSGATPTQRERAEKEQAWRAQEKQKQEATRAKSDARQQQLKAQAQMNPDWGLKNGLLTQEEYAAAKQQQIRTRNWYNSEQRRMQSGQAGPAAPVPSPATNFVDYYAQR